MTPEQSLIEHKAEYYRLSCALLRIVISVCEHPATRAIANRLALLARVSFIPSTGHGNTSAVAFLLGMTESGSRDLAIRRNLPVLKPGDERIYEFRDITKAFSDKGKKNDEVKS